MQTWLATVLKTDSVRLTPASTDASFRRYWRVWHAGQTWIAMDAPPEVEDCGRYADLARRWRAVGLNTPEIIAEAREQGFLLISDFGERLYLQELSADTADQLYGAALNTLERLQTCAPTDELPRYDAALLTRELGLFDDWFLTGLLQRSIQSDERARLTTVYQRLLTNALEQPQVCVHRDYHSRNLMRTEQDHPGVLDFQDAVLGPITYDVVSLVRDCYIAWPESRVQDWSRAYYARATAAGLVGDVTFECWQRWFDLMGMQRHLKACGIFARLKLRDGKPGYIADIPRTLNYVIAVAGRYADLQPFGDWLKTAIWPMIELQCSE
ncbi:aminoglycoside phosphotransferase family protein [Allochromatium warmingii]|uniref:aminoglycoside phosphotransferase family protein n=1 Tax=Allochromatium warmingii TaxID=61595 RepID=UPI001FDEEE71|nr:phosphotransferase [Allochromatium warmingii]